jgi:hypothetical protein
MFKKDSPTHDLLGLAKVFNRPFTPSEVLKILATLDRESRVVRSAELLTRHGCLRDVGNGAYMITEFGRDTLYKYTGYTSDNPYPPPQSKPRFSKSSLS